MATSSTGALEDEKTVLWERRTREFGRSWRSSTSITKIDLDPRYMTRESPIITNFCLCSVRSSLSYDAPQQVCKSQPQLFWDFAYFNATSVTHCQFFSIIATSVTRVQNIIWRSEPTSSRRPCCNLSWLQVSSREVNGRLVLEGVLTIYWGTETTVRLAETADNRVIARQRKTQSLYLDTRFLII